MTEKDITIVRREGSTCMADILADGRPIGEAIQLEDGFWYQWQEPGHHGGATQAWVLRAIADRLDEMNAPWDQMIELQHKADTFFLDVQTKLDEGNMDDALDILWNAIYADFVLDVPLVNMLMDSGRLGAIHEQIRISLLAITLPYKHELPGRKAMVKEVEELLVQRSGPQYAESVMSGLR